MFVESVSAQENALNPLGFGAVCGLCGWQPFGVGTHPRGRAWLRSRRAEPLRPSSFADIASTQPLK